MKNIALIGYGYWGPNLLRNIFETESANLVYCCDKDITRLEEVKKRYPAIKLTTNINEILKDETIDGVVIATPTKSHFPLAKMALEHNKNILIEKPMVLNYLQGKKLVELAKKKNKIIMVDHTFLFNDAIAKIKAILDAKELGDILYIDSTRANLGLFQKDVNVIFDLASHDFSIIQYLLDEKPIKITGYGKAHFNKQEDAAYIIAEYKKDLFAHVHVSWLSPVKVRRMMIIGTKKMIVYDDTEAAEKIRIYDKGVVYPNRSQKQVEQIKIGYRSGDVWLPKIDIKEPLSLLIKTFIDAMDQSVEPKSSGKFGLSVVGILDSATKSLRKGKTLKLKNGHR